MHARDVLLINVEPSCPIDAVAVLGEWISFRMLDYVYWMQTDWLN